MPKGVDETHLCLFGKSNMHLTLNFFPDQPGNNQMYQSLKSIAYMLLMFNLYTVVKRFVNVQNLINSIILETMSRCLALA